jgi:iron(III) transport system substrate-binding protein
MKRGRVFNFTYGALAIFLLIAIQNAAAGGTSQADSNKPLVFYTSVPPDTDTTITAMAKEAGFNVEIIAISGADCTNRLIAEKNNPIADGVFGLNPVYFNQLKKAGVLAKWEPSWVNKIDKTIVDPDGYYYPWDISPVFFFFNADMIGSAIAPKDWPDLGANPVYKGKYNIYGLGGQTCRVLLFSIIQRYTDPNGELGISTKGWEVMKQFIQNGYIEQTGDDTLGNIISGVRPISMGWASRLIDYQKVNPQVHLDIIIPPVGVPYVVQQTGIVQGSKNIAKTKAFWDWFGSTETMSKLSAAWNLIPANQDAIKNVSPEIQNVMNRLHPQQMDWELFDKRMGAWIEKIQLEFVQ